jgi:hypothetical protein
MKQRLNQCCLVVQFFLTLDIYNIRICIQKFKNKIIKTIIDLGFFNLLGIYELIVFQIKKEYKYIQRLCIYSNYGYL